MKAYKGVSLIELMIAMLVGFFVMAGAIAFYMTLAQGSSDTVKSARLNHDLDSVMQVMVNDVRRAGYWAGAIAGSDARNNPFTSGLGAIQIGNYGTEAADSCILYSYEGELDGVNDTDTTGDGNPDADLLGDGDLFLDLKEFYGFRLNDGGIDMRFSVGDIANTSCDDGNWENIINTDKISITALSFSSANSKCFNKTAQKLCSVEAPVAGDVVVETRQIDINIQGAVVGDAPVTKSLFAIVKVRNNRIYDGP